jgi:hypothetical protein
MYVLDVMENRVSFLDKKEHLVDMFGLIAWTVYQFFESKMNINFLNCLTDQEHAGSAIVMYITTPRNNTRLISQDSDEVIKILRNYLTITRFFGDYDKFPNQLSRVEIVLLLNATRNLHKTMFFYCDYTYPSSEICNQVFLTHNFEHRVYRNVFEW